MGYDHVPHGFLIEQTRNDAHDTRAQYDDDNKCMFFLYGSTHVGFCDLARLARVSALHGETSSYVP